MTKVQELKERKRSLGYSNTMVAELSGVPLGTVQKIFSGATASPRFATLQAIERALYPEQASASLMSNPNRSDAASSPRETSYQTILAEGTASASHVGEQSNLAYRTDTPRQGTYTVEDYRNLPEDVRTELIDGVFYDMASPTYEHQFLLGQLHARMLSFQQEHGYPCLPFMAPLAVQLDCDDKTMVEPDLIVLCDRSKLQKGIVFGAPDLVLEVLSPSTRRKDILLKFNKYWNAGVREYWIVDPDTASVIIHCFEEPKISSNIYTFNDQIPVGISGGELVIDMKDISALMRELLPEE